MRLIRIGLVLLALALPVMAQTNEIRKLSLEDCLALALQHNLDVQIKRYNPEISRFTLAASYGVYDPLFSASGAHDYNQSPGGFDPQGRPFGGTETDDNRFSTAFQGYLPSGLTYNLGARITDTYGTRPSTALGTTVTGFSTNTIYDPSGTPIGFLLQPNFETLQTRAPFENVAGNIGFFTLTQPLLKNFWIDDRRLQILLNKKELRRSELDLRLQVMTTVTDVETAYYNLIFAQENVKVQQAALALAERLAAENKKRVEVGALAPLDERQAESQAAASKADLLQALGAEDTQERVLKALLSDDYSKWQNVSIQPTETMVAVPERFNLQESWDRGLRLRPEVLQQQLVLEQQGYRIRYQRNQLFPQLDLVGDYGYNASSSEFTSALDQFKNQDNPFWSVGAQLTIPLGNTSARNTYRSAKATREQLALQLKQLQQNILIDIENAVATANTAFQRVEATHQATVYAREALEAEQKKLESGKSTSFEVLRLQRDLTSARSAEIRALADYNNALAQVALKEGSTLDRRHVTLEVK